MYVDQNVLAHMMSREFGSSLIANESTNRTVALLDLCGFTRISEKQSSDGVVKNAQPIL